jgi:hypothetical protein
LKSLWRSNEGRHIQEAGFAASLAGESGRYGDVHWIFRRQEPSSTDLKIARSVGYMGIFFGAIMLLALLIDLFNLLL